MKKIKIIVVFSLILIWEIVANLNVFPRVVFPKFSSILLRLILELRNLSFLMMILKSIFIIIFSLGISLILALIISYFANKYKIFNEVIDTFISILHPLPAIALLPLIILFFGVKTESLIIILLHSTLWPLIINIRSGFENIPKKYFLIAKNYELSSFKRIFKIMIPASLPYILNGIEVAWARAFRALISSEMVFGAMSGGIGYYIFEKRAFMDTEGLYAGILIVIIIGVLVNNLIFKKYRFQK